MKGLSTKTSPVFVSLKPIALGLESSIKLAEGIKAKLGDRQYFPFDMFFLERTLKMKKQLRITRSCFFFYAKSD